MKTNPTSRPAPAITTVESQWQSVRTVAEHRLDAIALSRRLQQDAGRQLDAAHYALGCIMDELATVMRLPDRRASAAVYRIDPSVERIILPERQKKRPHAA